jgi:hypothetical protein
MTDVVFFVVAFAAVAVGMAAVLAWLPDAEAPLPAPAVPQPVPLATFQPLLVSIDGDELVLDGLVDVGDVGAPIALRLVPPHDDFLAHLVEETLETWVAQDREVMLDLSKVRTPQPSIGFASGDTRLRLEVA